MTDQFNAHHDHDGRSKSPSDQAAQLNNALRIIFLVLLSPIWAPLALIYAIVIALISSFQFSLRSVLYMHHFKYPFNARFEHPEMFGFGANRTRNFSIKSADETRIGVWHILPTRFFRDMRLKLSTSSRADESIYRKALLERPVALYFHGQAGHRGSPGRVEFYKNMTDRLNVNVISIDYRGFGDSAGFPSEDGIVQDAEAVWNWIVEQGVDPSRIMVVGHSLGTGVATALVYNLKEKGVTPQALILQAPYSSMSAVIFDFRLGEVVPLLAPFKAIPWMKNLILARLQDTYDSESRISSIRCPVLIIYGRKDMTIPGRHGRRLFQAAVNGGPGRYRTIDLGRLYIDDDVPVPEVFEIKGDHVELLPWEGRRSLVVDSTATETEGEGGGEKRSSVREGPPKVMLVELFHGDHNNVQSFATRTITRNRLLPNSIKPHQFIASIVAHPRPRIHPLKFIMVDSSSAQLSTTSEALKSQTSPTSPRSPSKNQPRDIISKPTTEDSMNLDAQESGSPSSPRAPAGGAAGCGGDPNPPNSPEFYQNNVLSEVGDMYNTYFIQFKKPPQGVKDLNMFAEGLPTGVGAVRRGEVVVLWGVDPVDPA
ncbi:hypothetical protein HK102_008926, partial [Quaeritorhiza haematococci]